MDPSGWVELCVRARLPADAPDDEGALEPLWAACREVSPAGWSVEGPDAPPGDDPPPAPGTRRVRVYVPEGEAEAARARLEGAMAGVRATARPLDPDWQMRWKQWFRGFRASARLGVRPPWEHSWGEAGPEVDLVIEPGMAFGTGGHATTRVCLELLDEACPRSHPPAAMLDVGCGSGIVAIAALRLGVARAVGVDTETDAVEASRANAARNGAEARLEVSTTGVEALDERFSLVVANIITPTLAALVDDIAARVAPGGRLLLSGVLAEQRAAVVGPYESRGLELREVRDREGWLGMVLERPA